MKIVPRALEIYADGARLWPVYERISELGVPIVAQAGASGEQGDRGAWGRPKYFEKALTEFPNLVVSCAHLGWGYEDDVLDSATASRTSTPTFRAGCTSSMILARR